MMVGSNDCQILGIRPSARFIIYERIRFSRPDVALPRHTRTAASLHARDVAAIVDSIGSGRAGAAHHGARRRAPERDADHPRLSTLHRPATALRRPAVAHVTEAFRLGDVDVKFTPVSSNRAITGVMMGLYDGGFGWAHAADRDRKLLYSDNSIYTFRMVFFQRRGDDHPWKTLADLAPLQIGTTLGDHYSDEFSALQETSKLHVQVAASDLNNMRKLLVGRIDLFPMEEEAGKLLIQGALTPAEQNLLSCQSVAISAVPTFLVLRRTLPRAQELIARFDRGYRQLLESGRLAKMMEETRKAMLNSPMTFNNSSTAP